MPRPERLVVVAGTGTEVGKTWLASALATDLLVLGNTVSARKPVQSFEPGSEPTDADVLALATGEEPFDVCPSERWFPVPMAPPMAAEALGRSVPTVAEMVESLRWADGVDVGLVEAVGGVRSPLASDGDTVALVEATRPDAVIVVADPGLGTVNSVRLTVEALVGWPVVVFLNRFDAGNDLHRRNQVWLFEHEGLDVVTDAGAMSLRHPDWCKPRGRRPSE